MTPRSRILTRGGVALGAVLLGSAWYTIPHTHRDLTQEALRHLAVELGAAETYEDQPHHKDDVLDALAPYGITNLTMSGHTATVTGSPRSADEIARLKEAAVRWGVADLKYEVDDDAVATIATGAQVSLANGVVTLRGTVASEAQRQLLVRATQQVYGAANVVDRLTDGTAGSTGTGTAATGAGGSGATLRDAQVDALASMISAAGKATSLEGSVSPTALRFRASVASSTAKVAADAAAASAASITGLRVDSVITAATTATTAAPTTTAAPPTTAAPTTTAAPAPTTTAAPPTTAAPAPTTTAAPTLDQQVDLLQKELNALAAIQLQSVFFASGAAELTPEAEAVIAKVAEAMAKYPLPVVEVGGHTDSDGDDEANRVLSELRAGAVRQALVGRGVAAARLSAVGYGETAPRADNATAEGRAANRRVEFIVKKG